LAKPTAIIPFVEQPSPIQTLIDSKWSENTVRNYSTGWNRFASWCRAHDRPYLPASDETVCLFFQSQADRPKARIAPLEASYKAIGWMHRRTNFPTPTDSQIVRTLMGAVRKKLGTRQTGKDPLRGQDLVKVIQAIDRRTLVGKRDVCALLVCFWCALRRGSLSRLRVDSTYLQAKPHGYDILLDKSKTDQKGKGVWFHLIRRQNARRPSSLCPCFALEDWLSAAKIEEGFLFRKVFSSGAVGTHSMDPTGRWFANLVKERCEAAGIDPETFSGHSLRAGFVTEGLEQDVPTVQLRDVTGHKSDRMLERYWRHVGPSEHAAARKMKLPGE
jgi:integrase